MDEIEAGGFGVGVGKDLDVVAVLRGAAAAVVEDAARV